MLREKSNLLDAALWNAFRKGDYQAFNQIYMRYSKDLLSYGIKITNDLQMAEDSLHDLFIELWTSRKNLSDTDSIKFYLFKALRNKVSKMKSRDQFYQMKDLTNENFNADEFVIENYLIEIETHDQLQNQLKKNFKLLSPRQQQALNLRFYHHFNNEEIAEVMGINYQSACKFIYSGIKALKDVVRILSLLFLFNL
jgi:RNA polymerase sigma factor (sigma-70 family)|tara:strand:+ start:627 stop:1214 length:588 start_codon:yes stop_codon:yes gene_type:complete